MQSNVEKSLKSGMTEAKILLCEKCNTSVTSDYEGVTATDQGTRVITIIEATDEMDSNAVMSSNAIFGGGNDRRSKRAVEAAALAGNGTAVEAADGWDDKDVASVLTKEMARVGPKRRKTAPIKRDVDVDGPPDMTQAIMEQRADYDVDDEFRAANGYGYDAPRIRPANNYRGFSSRGYNQRQRGGEPSDSDERLEDEVDDGDDGGDHNSHYEYVPMEFDEEGNHR